MSLARKRPAWVLLVGIALLLAFPLSRLWQRGHGELAVERLLREKREAYAAVAALATKDLACTQGVEVRDTTGELWAHGCGKRGRYVRAGDGFRLAGEVEKDEPDDGCLVRWTRDGDRDGGAGADTARDAAARLHAAGKIARVRVPIAAFDIKGFAKLRYGENIDAFVEIDAGAIPDEVPVPCLDPGADGGFAAGHCTKPWDAVTEIAECR